MRYALLIYNRPGAFEHLPEERQREVREAFAAVGESPGVTAGFRLKAAEHATTVRMQDDRVLVTDGPFADTKEVLGGVVLVEAENIDGALELAKKVPTLPLGSAVEVRPLFAELPV